MLGIVLSFYLTRMKDEEGNPRKGDSRLYRIVVSESAHLIWKLRNDRAINGKEAPSSREIFNKWNRAINNRLELDCLLTNSKFGSRKLSKSVVTKTWQEVLHNRDSLPKDWTRETGVFVSSSAGIG